MNTYGIILIVIFAFQWGIKSAVTVWETPNEKAGEGFIKLGLWIGEFALKIWLLYEAIQCRG